MIIITNYTAESLCNTLSMVYLLFNVYRRLCFTINMWSSVQRDLIPFWSSSCVPV